MTPEQQDNFINIYLAEHPYLDLSTDEGWEEIETAMKEALC